MILAVILQDEGLDPPLFCHLLDKLNHSIFGHKRCIDLQYK